MYYGMSLVAKMKHACQTSHENNNNYYYINLWRFSFGDIFLSPGDIQVSSNVQIRYR